MSRRRRRAESPVQPPAGGTVSRVEAFESAVAWCAAHGGSTSEGPTLRSPALRPPDPPRGRKPDKRSREYLQWLAAGVESIVERRLAWLQSPKAIDHADPQTVVGGAALLFIPERLASPGIAESETRGYFDLEDEPPWDTWAFMMAVPKQRSVIARFLLGEYPPSGALVAWVPPALLELVTEGVENTIDGTLILVPRAEAEPLGEFVSRIGQDAPATLRSNPGFGGR